MKGKVVRLSGKNKYSEQVSLEECRKLFNVKENGYTDEELIMMRDFLYVFSRMYYDFYIRTFRDELKVIQLNSSKHDTEKSNSICTSEYRRAS